MTYTAIFQDKTGLLTRGRYTGAPDRHEAWEHAARMGEAHGGCLIAMIPGDHPVYTYPSIFGNNASIELKNHDVYEINTKSNVFQMT